MSIDDAAARGRMSPVTWGRVEKGHVVRGLTYAGVERVLNWTSGSVDAVLAGGEPTPLPSAVERQESADMRMDASSDPDPAIQLVLDSGLPWHEKEEAIRGLIEERRQEESRRMAHAQRYIDLYRRAKGG